MGDPLAADAALRRAVEDELIARVGGIAPRSRPISAAGGWRSGPRDSRWSRFVPSTRSRVTPSERIAAGRRVTGHTFIVRCTPRWQRPATGLLLLVDLDGVLYRGAEPVPGVAAVLAARAALGDDVVYVTNNSMWYRAEYVERIAWRWARRSTPTGSSRRRARPRSTCATTSRRSGTS